MRYLTDGIRLYEVIGRHVVQNYGLLRGSIRYVVIRDCVTETTARLHELNLGALTEVR